MRPTHRPTSVALFFLLTAALLVACAPTTDRPTSQHPADPSLADHMTFNNVVADASKHPAQITATLVYSGTVTANGVTIWVKTGEDYDRTLGDMAPGSRLQFKIEAAADTATYSMGVAWQENGKLGW